MLKAREIDLLGTMQRSEERLTRFDFCDKSYGYTVAELVALPDSGVLYQDYAAIERAVIGCVAGYVRLPALERALDEHGIEKELRYYDHQEALIAALRSGEIDMAAANSHLLGADLAVVEKFGTSLLYFATWKGNAALTDAIDGALMDISIFDADFDERMLQKYMASLLRAPFTKAELDCAAGQAPFTLYFDAETAPLAWLDKESGQMRGAYIDVCDQLAALTGLRFVYQPMPKEPVAAQPAAVRYETLANGYPPASPGDGDTTSILDSTFDYYYRVDHPVDMSDRAARYTLAIPAHREAICDMVRSAYPHYTLLPLDTPRDCIDAVRAGKADLTFLSSYVYAQIAIAEGSYDLTSAIGYTQTIGVGLTFYGAERETLAGVINKANNLLDNDVKNGLLMAYTLQMSPHASLRGFVRGNPEIVFTVIGVILLMLAAMCALFVFSHRRHKSYARMQRQVHEESRRFEAMVSNTPGGVMMFTGRNGAAVCEYVSEAVAQFHDMSVEETRAMLTSDITRLVHPKDREALRAAIAATLDRCEPLNEQYRVMRKSGDSLWVNLKAKAFPMEDGSVRVYCAYTLIDEIKKADIALQQQKEKTDFILRLTNMSVWNYDLVRDTAVWEMNPPWKVGAGAGELPANYTVEHVSLSGKRFFRVADASLADYERMFRRIAAGEALVEARILARDEHGSPLWKHVIYRTIFEAGKPVGATGYSRDITEMMQREHSFRREIRYLSEVHSENLLDKGQINITGNRLETYQSYYGSDLCAAGISYEEAIAALAAQAVGAGQRETLLTRFSLASIVRAFHGGTSEYSVKYLRRIFADRPPIWAQLTIKIFENPENRELNAFLYSYDINDETVLANVAGRLFNEDYNVVALLDTASGRIRVLRQADSDIIADGESDPDGYVYAEHMAGIIENHFLPADKKSAAEALRIDTVRRVLQSEKKYSVSYHIHLGEQLRRMRWDFIAMGEKPLTVIYTRTDVTALYDREIAQRDTLNAALEKAEKANAAKTEFLNTMSHDIRTPMNAILNLVQMARDDISGAGGGNAQEDLDRIETAGDYLKRLVDDVLDVSRMESGKMRLRPEVYDYGDFISHVNAVFLPLCEKKHITLRLERGATSVPLWVDRLRFNQLFSNLIANAVKYTPEGGSVSFRVYDNQMKDGALACKFEVSDTGCGMSEEFQQRMFLPFERENRVVSGMEGTGLGLYIVKQIVEQMGGGIDVRSRPGAGTVVTIALRMPLATPEQIAAAGGNAPEAAGFSLHGRHILAAEDNAMNVIVLERLLRREGMTVDTAGNGQEAVERFAQSAPGTYDVILMDLRMPVMDGPEAARRIRQLERADARTTPIIAVTADVFSAESNEAREAGMNDSIFKPIRPQQLYAAIRRHIGPGQAADDKPATPPPAAGAATRATPPPGDGAATPQEAPQETPRAGAGGEAFLRVLRDFGCVQQESTLASFVGDVDFYREMLMEMLNDPGFERLEAQLAGTDAKAAFATAHMLKGAIANTGITPMYETIEKIVEPLRNGSMENLLPFARLLSQQRERLRELVRGVQTNGTALPDEVTK